MRLAMIIALGLMLRPAGAGAHDPEARYLGNEGVMVSQGATKILFDAFYAESFGGQYTLVPSAMEQALLAGTAPFDGIDAIFVTHIHPDHFNSRKVIAFLRAHPNVRLYAGLDVIGAIYAADVGVNDSLAKRLVAVNVPRGQPAKQFTVQGLEIEAFSIPHNGNGPIPHYAFRVTLNQGATVMHLGDSDDAETHYLPYRAAFDAKPTDAAFVPTWLLTSDSGKRVLQQIIRPEQIIAIHADDKNRASAPTFRKELGTDAFLEPGETRAVGGKPR
jgi:L-ascorbate metabolism protein UlaG (beta-lactamase superfamily)